MFAVAGAMIAISGHLASAICSTGEPSVSLAQGFDRLAAWFADHPEPGLEDLHLGFLNMMPDASLEATERQFYTLVGESNPIAQFYMHPFTVAELARGPTVTTSSGYTSARYAGPGWLLAGDAGSYRTVGTSFEFGGLQDGGEPSTRAAGSSRCRSRSRTPTAA